LVEVKLYRYGVSILILLEVPLQLVDQGRMLLGRIGFNPYFTGSTTSTACRIWEHGEIVDVSILILLEVPLQPNLKKQ